MQALFYVIILLAHNTLFCYYIVMEKYIAKILAKLMTHKGDWIKISKDSGVSYSWISKFANNKIPNPGVYTLEKLDKALK